MAMYQIIPKPILFPEIFEVAGEIGEMRIEFQLVRFFLSCLEMDQSCILR
jgi:hypothetical protein